MTEDKKNQSDQLTSIHQPVYSVAMMLMNSIPVMGPAIAWGVGAVIPDPGQVARDQFIIGLAAKVDAFLERDQIERALRQAHAPALLSYAMNMASRSFGEEKLEALRNATMNGVFHSPQNVNLTAMVFALLDRLTEGHVSLLKAIGDMKNLPNNHVSWDRVRMLGVQFKRSPEGMRSPTSTLAVFEKDETFFDAADVEINDILLDDMVSLGLIERRFTAVPEIQAWSTDPSKNLPDFGQLTQRGRMVLEHILEGRSVS